MERMADVGNGVEGLLETHVAQVDGDGLVPELGIEDEVDAGRLAQRLVDLAQARASEGEAERLLRAGAESEPGQAALARAVLELIDGGRGRVGPPLRLHRLDLAGQRGRGGVEVARELE